MSRHYALGPVLWRSIEDAELAAPDEKTAWQYGVARTADLADNTRGIYGPLLSVGLAIAGVIALPVPLYARVILAAGIALLVYWLIPTLIAGGFALYAPYAQRDQARTVVKQLWEKLDTDLAAERDRFDEAQRNYRESFDQQFDRTESIRGQLGDAETRIRELSSELHVARLGAAQGRVITDFGHPVLREKIDAMVRRGFALYKELDTGPEPTETDEEGRGLSFPFFPPDSKWEPVEAFAQEAVELLEEHDPGLLFAYANGLNEARKKLRKRERQRNQASKKLPSAEQMHKMIDRLHRRPAEELECIVNALVDVKKELRLGG